MSLERRAIRLGAQKSSHYRKEKTMLDIVSTIVEAVSKFLADGLALITGSITGGAA